MVVLMKECGLATIWRVWATNAFRGPRPVAWGQNIILMLTGVQKTIIIYMWQTQVENEHYSTVSGLIRLVISLECFIEITPDFLCPFMND